MNILDFFSHVAVLILLIAILPVIPVIWKLAIQELRNK